MSYSSTAWVKIQLWPIDNQNSKRFIYLTGNEYMFGRHPDCDVLLTSPYTSRKHCKIFMSPSKKVPVIWDYQSDNGTFVEMYGCRGRIPPRKEIQIENTMRISFGDPNIQFIFLLK